MKKAAGRTALLGVLGALTLTLSFLEGLLPPLPMTPPGFKLGLSNLVCMFAAESLGLPAALFLAVLKGGFAFLGRGVTAGLMSLSGAVLSTLCSNVLLQKTKLSYLIIGVCGAMAHNAAQLLCAWALTTRAVLFYLPMLVLLSVGAGLLTGLLLRCLLPLLQKAHNLFSSSR